jgi:HTH-type transcriptional regulator/antitoxin HigA
MTPTKARARPLHPDADSYMRLVRQFPLRPVRTERQYDRAVEVMEKLAIRDEDTLDRGEADYLDVLSDLIEAYQELHYPIPQDTSSPLDRLKFLMHESKMTVSALGKILGSQPAASMVLHGKRELSKAQVRRLAEHFRLDPGYFL